MVVKDEPLTLLEMFQVQLDLCTKEYDDYLALPPEDQDPEVLAKKLEMRESAQLCLDHSDGIPH